MQTVNLRENSRALISVGDLMSAFGMSYDKHRNRSRGAGIEYYGPCPRAGCDAIKDGFSVAEGPDGATWYCRKCDRRGEIRRHQWYGDWLLMDCGLIGVLDRKNAIVKDGDSRALVDVRPVEVKKSLLADPKIFTSELNSVKITLERLEEFRSEENKARMMSHLERYNITPAAVDLFQLGYAPKLERYECTLPAGYAFPNITSEGRIRGVSIRRDDEVCKQIIEARGPVWIAKAISDLFDKWCGQICDGKRPSTDLREPTIQDLIDDDPNWTKYKSMLTSHNGIWNDRLVTSPDNFRLGPILSSIFIVEGVRDALALLQLGYPAVAFSKRNDWLDWFPRVFKRVYGTVYVVGDRDEGFNNKGAGEYDAIKINEALLKGYGTPNVHYTSKAIVAPVGFDDVSSLCQAEGTYGVKSWVQGVTLGLVPELAAIE